jgi:hypothetical protein
VVPGASSHFPQFFYSFTADLSPAVQHAKDRYGFVADRVERQIRINDQTSDAKRYVVARPPGRWKSRQLAPALLDGVERAIGARRTIRCDVRSDCD